jgi:DNA modification methylase
MTYNAAENSAKSYALAIETLRGKLASFKREQIGDCTLYLGDCREILPLLPKVDAVVTDPPYGIGESAKKSASREVHAKPTDYGTDDWDHEPADPKVIAWMRANSRWQVIFGGNYFDLPPTSCWLVWDKLNGDNDFADCELAWTNLPKAVRRIKFMWNGMLRAEKGPRVHLTQKPIEVMRWVLNHVPEPNGTVLDPYMGSGTTGVAVVMARRKFIGIEIEPKYFEVACKRIEAAYAQPDMFVETEKRAEQLSMIE